MLDGGTRGISVEQHFESMVGINLHAVLPSQALSQVSHISNVTSISNVTQVTVAGTTHGHVPMQVYEDDLDELSNRHHAAEAAAPC